MLSTKSLSFNVLMANLLQPNRLDHMATVPEYSVQSVINDLFLPDFSRGRRRNACQRFFNCGLSSLFNNLVSSRMT